VDVEEVLMTVYGVSPDYLELPQGVLGRTVFHANGLVDVHLSRGLSERAERGRVARQRLRSTMGHECGHVALHRHLQLGATGVTPPDGPTILCRDATLKGESRRGGEWWEYQANRAMASLLMPKDLVSGSLCRILSARGHESLQKALESERGPEVLRELSRIFDVSFEMALYRLGDLGLLPRPAPGPAADPSA
jgi:Zn-dependent peptidase ImmA (M78 family)